MENYFYEAKYNNCTGKYHVRWNGDIECDIYDWNGRVNQCITFDGCRFEIVIDEICSPIPYAVTRHFEDKLFSMRDRVERRNVLDDDVDYFVDDEEDSGPNGNRYTPSSTNHDYSPSNPWDAPGMSIHDFI